MDEAMILECIDSLWFFSNLLTPSPPLMLCREKPKEAQPMTEDFLRKGPKARGPSEVLTAESTEEKANEESDGDPKCGKAVSTEQSRVESNQKQTANLEEAQNQIHTMSCGERGSEARPVSADRAHRRMRRACMMERFVTPLNCYYALPSFSDSLAMRKHLKCWAQAVACTVR